MMIRDMRNDRREYSILLIAFGFCIARNVFYA